MNRFYDLRVQPTVSLFDWDVDVAVKIEKRVLRQWQKSVHPNELPSSFLTGVWLLCTQFSCVARGL